MHARPYDYVATTRAVTQPAPDVLLSKPELGQTDAARGLRAAADRAGDVVVAFVQGEGASRQVVAATFDRAPGTFVGYTTSTHFVKGPNPLLKWGTSFELWGPLTYTVLIDGKPVGQTQATNLAVPTPIPDGVHTWRVVATDRRGQATATKVRNLRIDGTAPKASFKLSGARRRGGVVKVAVKATDASGTSAKASGIKTVSVNFGDRSKAVKARKANHSYRRARQVHGARHGHRRCGQRGRPHAPRHDQGLTPVSATTVRNPATCGDAARRARTTAGRVL